MTEAGPRAKAGRGAIATYLFTPVDITFLVFFRVYFAAVLLVSIGAAFLPDATSGVDHITAFYVAPDFHFTYHGFSWVTPWPGVGMHLHFAGLAVLSACVLAGFLYRIAAALLCLGLTYVFFLEKALYLNHEFLICLLSFLLIFLPAHRLGSVDARLWPGLKSGAVPAWTLWLLRLQVGIPYFYGGLAKLNGDWLEGQPMQLWLSISAWKVLLGPVAEERWLALVFSWGGLLFDLAVVPLLLWRRTRGAAFAAAVVFHLLNAFMFEIGIFPWLMIGATTVFLAPDWPRRLVAELAAPPLPPTAPPPWDFRRKLTAGLVAAYAAVQVLLPLRVWLYAGNVLWTEEGYLFSWRMMLRAKVNSLRFHVLDRRTGQALPPELERWLNRKQVEAMGHDPEMLREFAHFLRAWYEEQGHDVEVRVLALSSLNGRRPQPLVDPRVDLSREPRTWGPQRYVVPLREPFRHPAWDVPVADWDRALLGPRTD